MAILRLGNPLAYPGGGGLPGFNPNHPAAGNVYLSAVPAQGGNYINVLTGGAGTVAAAGTAGVVTFSVKGLIGPSNTFTNGEAVEFSSTGFPSTPTYVSFACFYMAPTAGSAQNILTTSTGSTGVALRINSSNVVVMSAITSGNTSTGITLTAGHVYFIAMSLAFNVASGILNVIVVDIGTGKPQTFTSSSAATQATGNGTLTIGSSSVNSPAVGQMGPVMFSTALLTIPVMRAWGQAPWDFWYPPTVQNLILTGLEAPQGSNVSLTPGAGSLALSANAPILGTGIFPPSATLTISANSPAIVQNAICVPAVASLTLSPLSPSIVQNFSATPAAASLAISPATAFLDTGIVPPGASITLTPTSPGVGFGLFPPSASLTITPTTPTTSFGAGLSPSAAALAITFSAPTLDSGFLPLSGSISIIGETPLVFGSVSVTPDSASLTLEGEIPTVVVTAPPTPPTPPSTTQIQTSIYGSIAGGILEYLQNLWRGRDAVDRTPQILRAKPIQSKASVRAVWLSYVEKIQAGDVSVTKTTPIVPAVISRIMETPEPITVAVPAPLPPLVVNVKAIARIESKVHKVELRDHAADAKAALEQAMPLIRHHLLLKRLDALEARLESLEPEDDD